MYSDVKKIFKIYQEYYANSKKIIFVYILLALIFQGVQIVSPLLIAKIIDSAIYFKGMDVFIKFAIIGVILNLVAALVMPMAYFIVNKIWTESSVEQKKRLINRIPLLKSEIFKNTSLGNLLQLVESDLERTQTLVISDFVDLFNNIVYFIIVFIIVFKLHFLLTMMIICVVPLLIFTSRIMIPKIQECSKEYILCSEIVKNSSNEVFGGVLPIKLYNAYFFITQKIDNVIAEYQKIRMRYVKLNMIHFYLFTANILNISNMIVILLGAYFVIRGYITVGVITALLSYFSGLWGTYNFFINFWKNFKVKMISVDRIINFLEMPIELDEGSKVDEFKTLNVKNVSYNFENKSILSDISFRINKGEKVIISGDNGSGKTTLVKLLVGLLTPSKGCILYNDKILSDYNIHSLRERVCFIPAEPFIFAGSLYDNFFGKSDESALLNREKYLDIAKGGNNLSSGEKKILQLAVGLIQPSDIYILDEPLNFVDEISKKEIIESIKNDFSHKTLIIISHDSTPFNFCETNYLIKDEKLVDFNKEFMRSLC